jgi:hypothetical protein
VPSERSEIEIKLGADWKVQLQSGTKRRGKCQQIAVAKRVSVKQAPIDTNLGSEWVQQQINLVTEQCALIAEDQESLNKLVLARHEVLETSWVRKR